MPGTLQHVGVSQTGSGAITNAWKSSLASGITWFVPVGTYVINYESSNLYLAMLIPASAGRSRVVVISPASPAGDEWGVSRDVLKAVTVRSKDLAWGWAMRVATGLAISGTEAGEALVALIRAGGVEYRGFWQD